MLIQNAKVFIKSNALRPSPFSSSYIVGLLLVEIMRRDRARRPWPSYSFLLGSRIRLAFNLPCSQFLPGGDVGILLLLVCSGIEVRSKLGLLSLLLSLLSLMRTTLLTGIICVFHGSLDSHLCTTKSWGELWRVRDGHATRPRAHSGKLLTWHRAQFIRLAWMGRWLGWWLLRRRGRRPFRLRGFSLDGIATTTCRIDVDISGLRARSDHRDLLRQRRTSLRR